MSPLIHPTVPIRIGKDLYEIIKRKAAMNHRHIVDELEVLIQEAFEYERESHERAQRELRRRRRK